ncbi:MAG TPA: cytochrome c oxidase assembly protein [Bryobacteraceae bacterium]|jgi:cytochrome c oxidase assembly factor CtaG/polyferredoxin|nr:cytochrome c oxidase assembly protein [Bryobacteraceae bacterium]
MAEAVLSSWRFDPRLICVLCLAAWLYWRGWRQMHRQSPQRYTPERLTAYLGGLAALFIALASPLDAFGNLLLEAHMVQHLLLIVVAPPLILIGQPVLPFLRALPAGAVKDGLGPFLSSRGLRRAGRFLVHPVVCWLAMAVTVVFWHMPRWYELALNSPVWHGAEHACFFYAAILFWWPVVGVWPGRPQWSRWLMIPYLVLADMVNTGLSAWLVFSTHVVYRTYALAPRLGDLTALDDQTTAGAIMWVPGSIAFLIPAFVLTMQALNGERAGASRLVQIRPAGSRSPRRAFDLLRVPVLGAILRYRHFRRVPQTVMFALAVLVALDGFFGPQIAPLNLAGVLPWTYWRGFAVLALLAGGNFFCMVCPFMLSRDLGRRFLPARRQWPRALRSKWLAAGLLVVYLWAYEVFSLWSSPWWTAWIIAGYFVTAFVVDGIFEGASFCKYVCPIGQFNFVNSLSSPLEVKVRSAEVCGSCRTHDCIRGNETQRGCELLLFQPQKAGNFDCTFCLDCVHACPSDNVGILAAAPGSALISARKWRMDTSLLVWILVFGALVNAAAMVDPVMGWMHSLQEGMGLRALWPVTSGFYLLGIGVLPLLFCLGARGRVFGRALVPLGFGMWTAHFAYHLTTGWASVVPVLERLLHFSGAAAGAVSVVPAWLPSVQILLLDGGLLLSLYVAWRLARSQNSAMAGALRIAAPWALLVFGIYAASVWILFQPMQMRGMVM